MQDFEVVEAYVKLYAEFKDRMVKYGVMGTLFWDRVGDLVMIYSDPGCGTALHDERMEVPEALAWLNGYESCARRYLGRTIVPAGF